MKRRGVARHRADWRRVASLVGLATSVLLACEPRDQTPVGRGGRVFQRTCSGCHGPDGRGVMRLGLVKPPRDLTDAKFHASVTDEQLRSVIRTGKNQMPAFGGLMGDEDISNVIAFIRTLPPGAKPPPPAVEQAAPSAPSGSPAAAEVEPSPSGVAAPPSALVVPSNGEKGSALQ